MRSLRDVGPRGCAVGMQYPFPGRSFGVGRSGSTPGLFWAEVVRPGDLILEQVARPGARGRILSFSVRISFW